MNVDGANMGLQGYSKIMLLVDTRADTTVYNIPMLIIQQATSNDQRHGNKVRELSRNKGTALQPIPRLRHSQNITIFNLIN